MKTFVSKIEVLKLIEEMEVVIPFYLTDYLDMTPKVAFFSRYETLS